LNSGYCKIDDGGTDRTAAILAGRWALAILVRIVYGRHTRKLWRSQVAGEKHRLASGLSNLDRFPYAYAKAAHMLILTMDPLLKAADAEKLP
jgi:hypothetical protein